MDTPKLKSIYTTHEVSKLLHVNPRSVINWISQELLGSYRTPGGHRRIRHDDLMAFLRKHQIPIPVTLMNGGLSVLIVENEADHAGALKTFFESNGSYTINSAQDGITALIEVGRSKPNLLILDIAIPGVDGVDVCRRIKADSSNRTAIIAISNNAENDTRVRQAGADAFMVKPLDLDKLLAESKRLLRTL